MRGQSLFPASEGPRDAGPGTHPSVEAVTMATLFASVFRRVAPELAIRTDFHVRAQPLSNTCAFCMAKLGRAGLCCTSPGGQGAGRGAARLASWPAAPAVGAPCRRPAAASRNPTGGWRCPGSSSCCRHPRNVPRPSSSLHILLSTPLWGGWCVWGCECSRL